MARRTASKGSGGLIVRPDRELARWANAVRQRDSFRCQFPECNYRSRHIVAHHKAPRGKRPDLRLAVNNGIALCFEHHLWVHMNPIEATSMNLLDDETYELAVKQRETTT